MKSNSSISLTAQKYFRELSETNNEATAINCCCNLTTLIKEHNLTPKDIIPENMPKRLCLETMRNAIDITELSLKEFYIKKGNTLLIRAKSFNSTFPQGTQTLPSAKETLDLIMKFFQVIQKSRLSISCFNIDIKTMKNLFDELNTSIDHSAKLSFPGIYSQLIS